MNGGVKLFGRERGCNRGGDHPFQSIGAVPAHSAFCGIQTDGGTNE